MDGNIYREFTKHLSQEIALQVIEAVLKELSTAQGNSSSKSEKEYLTREEVASLCKIKSLSTLWSWRKNELLVPTSKAGRKPLYLKSDVLQFLNTKKGDSNV